MGAAAEELGLIKRSGALSAPCIYDGLSFPQGTRPSPLIFQQGTLFGLMDWSGRILRTASSGPFDQYSYFPSGSALVQAAVTQNDRQGKTIFSWKMPANWNSLLEQMR